MAIAAAVKEAALSLVGQRYKLGEESFGYVVGPEQTKDPLDTDCSGIVYSVFRKVGVTVNGRPLPRLTAHDYWRMTTPIAYPGPFRVGDLAFQIRDGRAYHVTMVIDTDGLMIEAGNHGPGNTMPGSGYIGTLTTAQMQRRGGVRWGRWQTNIAEEVEDLNEAETRKLIESYLDTHGLPSEITEAEDYLIKNGLLQKRRQPARAMTWGLFVVLFVRLAKWLKK